MKKITLVLACLMLSASLLAPGALAGGPTAPTLLGSTPEAGAKLGKAPTQVSFTFSQPIDASHSRIEVYDQCGRRVDAGEITVDTTLTTMSAKLDRKPAGTYKAYYFMMAVPKGATGETDGITTFTAKKGRAC